MRRDRDLLPKCSEPLDAPFGGIAGDQRAVDGTDRDSGDPIRLQLGLGQRGIYTGLVRAECAAALQQQRDAFERGRRAGTRRRFAAIAAMAAEESWSMMNLLILVTMWAAARARPSLLIDQAWASA